MKKFNVYPNGVGMNVNGNTIELDGDILSKDIKTIKLPKRGNFANVTPGSELKVLSKSLTPHNCPFGIGLPMIILEKGVIAVIQKERVAWVQMNQYIKN